MTAESLSEYGAYFDQAFVWIAAAILVIELSKGFFSGAMKGRQLLDMVASAATLIPYYLVEIFLMSLVYVALIVVADNFAPWQMPINIWTVLLAMLVIDFIYYWEHRNAHRMRLRWTQHAVHHSSREMNMLISFRAGAFETFTAAPFYFPLVFLGFPPVLIFFGAIVVIGYQTWLHTEVIGKLGPLEGVFNTPSNHRVHHSCDGKNLGKNYGSVLIIWDRLFGTYQAEEETPKYGLHRDYNSVNPLTVWASELPELFRDLKRSKSFGEAWMFLFAKPGWQPKPETSRDTLSDQEPAG